MSKYAAYPSVVMVTMVYQNDAGMEVNVESDSLWRKIQKIWNKLSNCYKNFII